MFSFMDAKWPLPPRVYAGTAPPTRLSGTNFYLLAVCSILSSWRRRICRDEKAVGSVLEPLNSPCEIIMDLRDITAWRLLSVGAVYLFQMLLL